MMTAEPSTLAQAIAALHLASPLLPVGAYAYSQGIERAVNDGIIADEASARRWVLDLVAGPMAWFEAPLWLRLHAAAEAADGEAFARWNRRYLASRETHELRAETLQMGASLKTLARDLGLARASRVVEPLDRAAFPAVFAACAIALALDATAGLTAYLYGWIENQVAALLKAAPLGQLAGQRLLLSAHAPIADVVSAAAFVGDDDLVSSAPGLALSSALHETQYSRLFRS